MVAAEDFDERPIKTAGLPYVGIAVAIADCVVALLIVLRVHRALERRAGEKPAGG